MGYTHGTSANAELRTCTKCGETLPNTIEYFGHTSRKQSAICKKCKSVLGKEKREKIITQNRNSSLMYEGTRKCKHCGRDLPNNKLYFSIDLACKDGLRNVCRECSPKEAGFLDPNYKPNKPWTIEEDNLMKLYYKDYTGQELQELFFPDRSIRAIECHAPILGLQGKSEETIKRSRDIVAKITSEKLKGISKTEEALKKQSESMKEYYRNHTPYWKGKKRSDSQRKQISQRMKGKWAGDKNPRHINPLNGKSNGRWKGGVLDTYRELRSDTKEWQQESMKFCNYHCIITNGEFDNIHHTTSFRKIVDECFYITQLEVKEKVCDYDESDFSLLRDKLKQLHIYYGYGACLCEQVHKLFHDNYGYTKFAPYDFLDFVYRIDCGEFDKWFENNNLKININYEYIEYLESTLFELKSA